MVGETVLLSAGVRPARRFRYPSGRVQTRGTLTQGAMRIAEEASIRRAGLLMRPSLDVVALDVDAADGIGVARCRLTNAAARLMSVFRDAALTLQECGRAAIRP
jgi:hypothetical protein